MSYVKDGHPRVLVIEDDDAVVKVLCLSLKNGGFETASAESGRQALAAMDANAFDAIVLDACLPDNLAGDVLQRLRKTGRAPVWVVMSALDEEEVVRRYGPLQGRFVPKPFDPFDLISILEGLLAESEAPESRRAG